MDDATLESQASLLCCMAIGGLLGVLLGIWRVKR